MATTGTTNKSSTAKKSASSSSKTKSAAKKSSTPVARGNDAVAVLKRDHREVERLFKQYEQAKEDDARKQEIFQQIALELKVHTQVEEEIFYPESREFVKEQDTVNEAEVEHQSAKDLIAQLEGMQPSDDYYDAKVKVLQEMVEHHVEEEEKEYFPECQKSEMDTKAVGERILARKEELMGRMGGGSRAMH
ncbi:hemerythrin domain-containing protein [Phenylobacterium sp.]|jgi:hemerythrin superfamily protein|uniref:hemerythrin domain-containing protein n=1 Tax=Phenylobacterium sp. TaxID=1871053 RepID=UPI002F92426A